MRRLLLMGLFTLATLAGRSAGAFSLGEVSAATATHGTLAGTGAGPAHAALGTVRRTLPTIPVPDGLGPRNDAPQRTPGGTRSRRAPTASSSTGKAWATGGCKASNSSGKGWLTADTRGNSSASKAWETAASASSGAGSGKAWLQGGAK